MASLEHQRSQAEPASPRTAMTPQRTVGSGGVDVATSVFTNSSLVWTIGSFQEDPATFVATYRVTVLGLKKIKKVVCAAVRRGDLHVLQMMYTARRLNLEAAENPELSFQYAMRDAVREGKVEIIKWLHARSLRHPLEIDSFPDADTLRNTVHENNVEVLQCLLELHDDEGDRRWISVLEDGLRQNEEFYRKNRSREATQPRKRYSPYSSRLGDDCVWALSLFVLFVRQRPALHDTLLRLAIEAKSSLAVRYVLSPRNGVDITKMRMLPSIVAAARGGERCLMKELLTVKHPDEAVTIDGAREQLRGVGDADALQLLVSVIVEQDPAAQQQLDAERDAIRVLFGLQPSKPGLVAKRRAVLRQSRRPQPGKTWPLQRTESSEGASAVFCI